MGDGVPEGYVFKGKPQEDIELYLSAIPRNYEEALEEAVRRENSNVSCIVGDSFLWFAGQMAEKLEVPWVSFWTSGACSLSAHFYTDRIRRTIGTVPDGMYFILFFVFCSLVLSLSQFDIYMSSDTSQIF